MIDPLALLTGMIGQRLTGIEQGFYVFKGVTDRSNGFLQLRSASGLVMHLWGAGDGESVRIVTEPWEDPFQEPLSEENRAFVAKSGKWTLFDVSTEPEMAPLIDQVVQSITPVRDRAGELRGVRFAVGTALLTYVNDCDEGVVLHGPALDELRLHDLSVAVAADERYV